MSLDRCWVRDWCMVNAAPLPRPTKLPQASPGSGRPAKHVTPRQPLPVSPRAERERLPLFASCSPSASSSSLPLFSLPPLVPLSASGGNSIGGLSSEVRLRKTPFLLLPPILVTHLPASQSRQGAVLAPWGQECAEKEGEVTARG